MAAEPVVKATMRANVFNTIATLLNDNKLSGWAVLSAFPEQNPVFPCIVVNPAKGRIRKLVLDGSKTRRLIEVTVEIYTLGSDTGKEESDKGADNVTDTLTTNTATLLTNNLVAPMKDGFIIDEAPTAGQFNENNINIRSMIVNLVART